MIRCIVISPDFKLRQALINGLQATPGVALLRTLDHYPLGSEAGRLMDSLRPEAEAGREGPPSSQWSELLKGLTRGLSRRAA